MNYENIKRLFDEPPQPLPRHANVVPNCTKCVHAARRISDLMGGYTENCPPQGNQSTSNCYGTESCQQLYSEKKGEE